MNRIITLAIVLATFALLPACGGTTTEDELFTNAISQDEKADSPASTLYREEAREIIKFISVDLGASVPVMKQIELARSITAIDREWNAEGGYVLTCTFSLPFKGNNGKTDLGKYSGQTCKASAEKAFVKGFLSNVNVEVVEVPAALYREEARALVNFITEDLGASVSVLRQYEIADGIIELDREWNSAGGYILTCTFVLPEMGNNGTSDLGVYSGKTIRATVEKPYVQGFMTVLGLEVVEE